MRSRVFIALLLAIFGIGCGGSGEQVRKNTNKGLSKMTKKQKKNFIEEEELTEKKIVIKKAPTYIPGVDKAAQDAFRAGVKAVLKTPADYATAKAKFEEAIEKDPKFLEAYFNLGMVYERTGQPDKAIKVYERALKANPKSVDAKAYIGKVYLAKAKKLKKLGRDMQAAQMEQKAKALFDEVIKDNPDSIAGLNAMALYWLYKGDLKTSEKYVKQVLMDDPHNVVALITRGLINYLSGKIRIARWIFEQKALKEDPNSTEAWNNLGVVYYKLGHVPKAVACYLKALQANPSNQEAMMNLAAIYLNYLNYKGAYDLYSKVLKLDPENPEALIGMGTSSLGMKKYADAIKYYEQALKVNPKEYILYKRIGEIYEGNLNKLKMAIKYYEKYVALANPPQNDEIRMKIPALKQMLQMQMNPPKMPPAQPGANTQQQGQPAQPGQGGQGSANPGNVQGNQPQGQKPGVQQPENNNQQQNKAKKMEKKESAPEKGNTNNKKTQEKKDNKVQNKQGGAK